MITAALPSFFSHLIGQMDQLLHREQAAAAVDQSNDALVEFSPPRRRQGAVATGMDLGDQMKAGLIYAAGQNRTQNLLVQSQLAIEIGTRLMELAPDRLKIPLRGGPAGGGTHRIPEGARAAQALPIAATSAAKSLLATSMPSPRVKRLKRRTWMFSPVLPAACFTSSATVIAVSRM